MTIKDLIFIVLVISVNIIQGYSKTGYDKVLAEDDSTVRSAFDLDLYEDVLNPEQCNEQLAFLSNHSLRLHFLDASAKIPSGIMSGNLNDLGDYHQCLSINQVLENMDIQGKYCLVAVPLDQEIVLPEFPFPNTTWPEIPLPSPDNEPEVEDIETMYSVYPKLQQAARIVTGVNQPPNSRMTPSTIMGLSGPTLGVCIPKVCSVKQATEIIQESVFVNFTTNELYCRLPNDKPFAAADYVAFTIFGTILLLAALSTAYDLYFSVVLKTKCTPIYRSFSVYTNTGRFLTFNTYPGALECVDGIRAISMMWVIVGHTHLYTLRSYIHNVNDVFVWLHQFSSTWVNSAPITVDTFFVLSGMLCVYTTIGKINKVRFVQSIHLFYIYRLLRMFPLLAAVVLLQASVFNHVADGPVWFNVGIAVETCRKYWWTTLLHVQNYVNNGGFCLEQTWYLSVDVQLYIFCPLVLIFMFGSHTIAWCSVGFFILLSLVSSSLYSFIYEFSAAIINVNRLQEIKDYNSIYYMNTLARAPPFFVGMAYGYLLFLWKEKQIQIPRVYVAVFWISSLLMMAFCIISIYPVMQLDHDAQMFDNFLNAYMRAIWALGLGWLILACVKGYGGPINWFLSLRMWKLPSRLSYAMYLLHIPIITIANGSWTKTHYFTTGETMYRFVSDFSFTFVFAFFLSILIDAPFSTLQKLLLGKGKKTVQRKADSQEEIVENGQAESKSQL